MKTLMLTVAAAVVLISFADSADAARKRQRITVYPQRAPITERAIYNHPYAVDYALRSILCAFHVFSIGPQGKPGSCVQYLRYPSYQPV